MMVSFLALTLGNQRNPPALNALLRYQSSLLAPNQVRQPLDGLDDSETRPSLIGLSRERPESYVLLADSSSSRHKAISPLSRVLSDAQMTESERYKQIVPLGSASPPLADRKDGSVEPLESRLRLEML